MYQINPNLKTLGQLISKCNFCDWFLNTSYTVTGQSPMNFLVQTQNWSPSTTPSWTLNCPSLMMLFGANGYYNNHTTWFVTIPNLLNMLYDLFENVIPYDQTTFSTEIQPSWNPNGVQYVTFDCPSVLKEIASYFGLYINRIIEWSIIFWKYNSQLTVLQNGYTNTYMYQTVTGTTSASNHLDINSFNPVTSNETVTMINPNVTNPQTFNSGGNGATTSMGTSAAIGSNYGSNPTTTAITNGANWSNGASSSATNSANGSTNYAVNLENFQSVGIGDGQTLLRPFIKKVSSLFWSLSNDYYGNNDGWGFNIW